MAETQGVWNWSLAATHRAIPATECCGYLVDNSLELGAWEFRTDY